MNRRKFFLSLATAIFGAKLAAKFWPQPATLSMDEFAERYLRPALEHINSAVAKRLDLYYGVAPNRPEYACRIGTGYWKNLYSEPRGSFAEYERRHSLVA